MDSDGNSKIQPLLYNTNRNINIIKNTSNAGQNKHMEKDGNNNKDEQKAYWRRSRGDGEQNDAVRCHGLQLLQCSAGVAETPSHRVSTRTFRVRRRLVTPEAVPFCCH